MKITKQFVLREIADEYIIVPTGNTAFTFNGIITVNGIGAFLWRELQEEVTFDQLVGKVLEEYETDRATAEADVREFLDCLKARDILGE